MPKKPQSKNTVVKNNGKKMQNKKTKIRIPKKIDVFQSTYDPSYTPPKLPIARNLPTMSKCALKYALAISKPFCQESVGACIPSTPSQATHKAAGFLRGDGAIGTAGVGFIICSPTVANDTPALLYSTAAYTSSSINVMASANNLNAGVVTSQLSNLPYNSFQLTNQAINDLQVVRGRVVSSGITIQYTGTALNESGMVYLVRDPNHSNVAFAPNTTVGQSTASVGTYQYTELCPFTREKCAISDFASKYDDLNFIDEGAGATVNQSNTNACYPYSDSNPLYPGSVVGFLYSVLSGSNAQVVTGSATMVIMVTGVPGQTFHFEMCNHCEYVGTPCQASLTPNETDAEGTGAVLTAANQIAQRKVASPKSTYWELMYQGLQYAAKKSAPIVIPALEKAVLALLV
jgi:hypothetical protein